MLAKFATNASVGGKIWPSGGQICNNASGAIWWPNMQLMQVVPWCVAKSNSSHGVNFWVRCASGNVY